MMPVSAVEGYQLWADTWDATLSPIAALEYRALLPWMEPWMESPARCRAIDVGCGTGRWTERLAAIGMDASPAMLAVAACKGGLRGRLAVGDAAALPVVSGVADLVLCALTFGHIRDQAGAMREFARVLQPGGTLILTDFHPDASARGWRRTFRRDGQVYELENHPYTVPQLCEMSRGLSLTGVVEASIGEPERELFQRAGRPDLFAAACSTPAVLLTRWVRI
jgi:ubiquinone/menaquinone biosynthesis C-methylase UbiE